MTRRIGQDNAEPATMRQMLDKAADQDFTTFKNERHTLIPPGCSSDMKAPKLLSVMPSQHRRNHNASATQITRIW
jgi:hypothetical protein